MMMIRINIKQTVILNINIIQILNVEQDIVAVVFVFTTAIPGDSTNGGSPVGVATANNTQIPRCCPSICSYLFTLLGTKFMYQGVSSSPVMVRDSRVIRDYAYGLALE